MIRHVWFMFAFALATVSCSFPFAYAENWPQWRGPRNDGTSIEKNIPTTWDKETGTNIAWRLPLPGQAGATPIVWNDRIFISSVAENPEDGTLLICASTDGKELWRKVVDTENKNSRVGGKADPEGNSASPSPSTDGKHVWVMMGTGAFVCYDFQGNEIWRKNLQKEYGDFNILFGMASTPILDGGKIYVQLIHSGGAKVIAFDKENGKEVWLQKRVTDAIEECEQSYASPTIYRDESRAFLLSHGGDYLIAHSLEDGHELWRCGGLNPKETYNPTLRFVSSPLAVKGMIAVPTAKNGPVLGLKPTGAGDITGKTEFQLWRYPRNTPDVPSPLVHDGIVYLSRESGNLIALDAKDGTELYEKRTKADRHRASPVYVDGKILISCRDGTVSVVQPGKEFKMLAQNKLGEKLSSSPVVSNGTLYLRTFNALYAIREQK